MTASKNENDGSMFPQRSGRPFRHIPVRSFDPESKVFYMQTEGGETRLGVCFQGQPMTGADEGTMAMFKSVLTTEMPPGTFVQLGLFSEPDVSAYVNAYRAAKNTTDKLLSRLTTRHALHHELGVNETLRGMNDVYLCRQRVIFSMSIPCETIPTSKEHSTIATIAGKMKDGLSTAGLWLVQMDEAEYLALIRRFFHLYDNDDYETDAYAPLREQVFGPSDAIDFGTSAIKFNDGEYYAKIISTKHFPNVANIALMNLLVGDPMGSSKQVTDPFWMTATIHYPDQNKKIPEVRQKYAWITNQGFGGLAHMIPMLKYKKQGIETLIHEMDGGGGILCEMNFTMTLFSRDLERLNGLATTFLSWAASHRFEMRDDKRILKPLFYLLLPLGTTLGGIKNLFRFHTMAVSHAIRMLPIIGNWGGTGMGGSSIFATRRGTLALFDPHDSSSGMNGTIIAGTGSGKSFLAQHLLCDWMAGGARAWVIDQGRSYEKLCRAKGGQFIEFSVDSDICLNPFTKISDIDDEMDLLKAMFAKMAAPEKGLGDFGMSALEQKIKAAYSKYVREADVDAVAEQCLNDPEPRIQDIGRQLFPFTRQGTFGRWFNGTNNVDLSNDFVVLELKELESRKVLQSVVLIQLFANISHEMYLTRGRSKYLLIDEAWSLLADPVMGKAIEGFYRTVRKNSGSAWLVNQDLDSLYSSPNGRAILGNCAWQLIMMQKTESIENAIRSGHLKLDVYEMNLLKSIRTSPGNYSEFMIKGEGHCGVVRYVSDRFAGILFSSKGWERDLIFDRMNAGENVVEVIDQLIKEGK